MCSGRWQSACAARAALPAGGVQGGAPRGGAAALPATADVSQRESGVGDTACWNEESRHQGTETNLTSQQNHLWQTGQHLKPDCCLHRQLPSQTASQQTWKLISDWIETLYITSTLLMVIHSFMSHIYKYKLIYTWNSYFLIKWNFGSILH